MENKITTIEEIISGEVVELPGFYDGKPFIAKLRRPSLLTLCYAGKIPNELLSAAQEIYTSKELGEGKIKEFAEVLNIVAEAAMIEPAYKDIKDYLTDLQIRAIFQYCQFGVKAMLPFLQIQGLFKDVDSGPQDKQTDKPVAKTN